MKVMKYSHDRSITSMKKGKKNSMDLNISNLFLLFSYSRFRDHFRLHQSIIPKEFSVEPQYQYSFRKDA